MRSTARIPADAGLRAFLLPSLSNVVAILLLAMTLASFHAEGQNDDHAPSNLGPFELQERTQNPLRPTFNNRSRPDPVPVDFDRDGDIDIALGDYYGADGLFYLRNDGTSLAPAYNQALYWSNPLEYINFPLGTAPSFIDMDGDNDYDMVTGNQNGTLEYYIATGVQTSPLVRQTTVWNADAKTGNPFFGLNLGPFTSPVFADMDNDGDKDLIVGSSYLPENKSIHYFTNNGNGNFSPAELTGVNPNLEQVTPALVDVNGDGLLDLLLGSKEGDLYYFQRTGLHAFVEKTGMDNPFAGINNGDYSNPSAADLDGDGDLDVLIGSENSTIDIRYFRNDGGGIFTELTDFQSPFGGYSARSDSYPYFTDINQDGNIDLIVGSSDNQIDYLRNVGGTFKKESVNNPFQGVITPENFFPSFIDIDNDGDRDLLGSGKTGDDFFIEFFRNDHGAFTHVNHLTGPFSTITLEEGYADFADVDGDGDYDLIASDAVPISSWDDKYVLRYFENTGTKQIPVFTERTNATNPFALVEENFELFPRFADIDHDGDPDLLIGEGGSTIENADGNEFSYYENISTPNGVAFRYRGDLIEQGDNPYQPSPAFVDADNDGDLDIFFGTNNGDIYYYKNINSAATLQLNTSPLVVTWGNGPVAVDPALTLSDLDNDSLVSVTVAIIGYENGNERLEFTPHQSIVGAWNDASGKLSFTGKAPISVYQSLLRTVTIDYFGELPESDTDEIIATNSSVSRSIQIEISDSDGTFSTPVERIITFATNSPPVFEDIVINIPYQGTESVYLVPYITDMDNNADYTSINVIRDPDSGGIAGVDDNFFLTVDYTGINFSGTEQIQIRVCDDDHDCDFSTVTINVAANTSPVIHSISVNTPYKGFITANLIAMTDDAENNIDPSTFEIITQPATGAVATIDAAFTLRVDYSASTFAGTDVVTIRVCDDDNACAEGSITINVQNSAPTIAPEPLTTPQGTVKTLNLLDIISDAENNLANESLTIVVPPISGAAASILPVSESEINLVLDYSGITFHGGDQLTIRACDQAGACSENFLTVLVEVVSTVEVYNAIALSGAGDNKYLRIHNLPPSNKVSIFNRWGDEVWHVQNYNNETNRFEGMSSNGKLLSNGTYFYTIEFFDDLDKRQTLTGYISLKN